MALDPPSRDPAATLALKPRLLTPAAFAPFGEIVRSGEPSRVNDGLAVRRDAFAALPCTDPTARLCLSVFDIDVRPAPILIRELERHPHSAQLFVPLSGCRALIVVAGATADGGIEAGSLTAFVAAPEDGILYAPGIWHLGLTSLDQPGRFQMATWCGERPHTEFRPLSRPVILDAGKIAAAF